MVAEDEASGDAVGCHYQAAAINEDEEFGSWGSSSCFGLLCSLGKGRASGYGRLQEGDCGGDVVGEGFWEKGLEGARRLLSKLTPRRRWRSLLQKMKQRRRPRFNYDSASYKLNFDDGEVE